MDGAFVQYAVDEFPVRLVGLDTQGTIGHEGDYDDERAGELEALLEAEPGEARRRCSCTMRRLPWIPSLPRFVCRPPPSV